MPGTAALRKMVSWGGHNLDRTRRERNNLMRGPGNDLTYPSCWTTPAGQTEYIFDVTLADAGVHVRDASAARASDKAWALVGNYHQMRKFHWAPHSFFFNPSSTSRRTAAASDGWSFCLAAQFLIRSCISSCIRTPTIGELPVAGRPRAFLGLSLIDFAISRSIG